MTWLYLPPPLSASAPAPADSISASDWRIPLLARSVTSNGKHSRPSTWLRRWKRTYWMRRLFGMISKPSTAAPGVASWIGSLAESHANLTASPARNGARPTSGISGRMPDGLSANVSPAQSSWRTFQASHGITSTPLGLSYEDWDTGLKRDFSQRQRLGLPTYENGSSSWVTPTARSSASRNGEWKGAYYVRENGTKVASVLSHQARNWQPPLTGLWQSPAATDAEGGTIQDKGVDPSQMICYHLRDQGAHWPTATMSDAGETITYSDDNPKLSGAARMWPTVLATDGTKAPKQHRNGDPSLTSAAKMWPTATVTPGAYTYARGNPDTLSLKLDGAARTFPTPSASAAKGFDGPGKAHPSKNWAAYSHLVRMTLNHGHECSPKCRRLNPLFVAWLMGWPGGWTQLPSGLNDSEFLATGWFRWSQLMRYSLSRLGH